MAKVIAGIIDCRDHLLETLTLILLDLNRGLNVRNRFLLARISLSQVTGPGVKRRESELDQSIPDMDIRGTLISLSSVSGLSLTWALTEYGIGLPFESNQFGGG